MSAADNRQMMQRIFAATAAGDGRPFVDALADDVCWTIPGSTAWSRRWQGKQAVLGGLLAPLRAQFTGPNRVTLLRVIAEDDYVVVEAHGNTATKTGQPYRNRYCWVCRIVDGRIAELTEYMDTALVDAVLASPP